VLLTIPRRPKNRVLRGAVYRGTVYRGTVYRGAVYRVIVYRGRGASASASADII
jgi:hypothetical protein